MSHDVISNVSLNQQMVDAMCSDGTIERMVDSTASHVGAVHGATEVEVDSISAQTESLPSITHFSVFNSEEGGNEKGRQFKGERDRELCSALLPGPHPTFLHLYTKFWVEPKRWVEP